MITAPTACSPPGGIGVSSFETAPASPATTGDILSGMKQEMAHYRRHPAEPRVDLLSARYVTHRYSGHAYLLGRAA
ncbi:MAG: hypothetical protein JWR24_5052 [Actinoallomurus sp.]|jgi:hypothetical protein|nr:hypothetical protein [Actinoallomurus sp.]